MVVLLLDIATAVQRCDVKFYEILICTDIFIILVRHLRLRILVKIKYKYNFQNQYFESQYNHTLSLGIFLEFRLHKPQGSQF